MSESLLVSCTCGRCGAPLDGAEDSSVLVCLACGIAVHAENLSEAYPLRLAIPAEKSGSPDLIAPFWRVEGAFSWQTGDRQKERVYSNLVPLGPLFIPAFASSRVAYYQDLTVRYAVLPGGVALGPGREPTIGGSRNPGTLGALARLIWMGYMDRRADVTGVEGSYRISGLAYVGVPFYGQGDQVRDGVLGISFPAALFRKDPAPAPRGRTGAIAEE